MLETYFGKTVQIFVEIDDRTLIYTGKILEETETHFRFLDKFGKELLLSKQALQQVKGVEI